GGRELATDFHNPKTGERYNPDFAAMARSAGVEGVRVDRAADLAEAVRSGINANRPYLIDVDIAADINPAGAGVWELPGLGQSKPSIVTRDQPPCSRCAHAIVSLDRKAGDEFMLLSGQKVVVVGGSSGIGLSTAELAKSEGADVVIASRNAERLTKAAAQLGVKAIPTDVTSDESVGQLFRQCGRVDHVVVTAAQLRTGPI